MNQSTLINLRPKKYSQGLHYYPFAVTLDRFVGSCVLPTIYLIEYEFQRK